MVTYRRGFSLIEITVVLAIVVVLAGMTLAAVANVKKASHRTVCSSNLRQAIMALNQFATEREGRVPLVYEQFKQATYMIWASNATPLARGWGVLFDDNYMDEPRAFYCPAKSLDSNIRYNATGNLCRAANQMTRSGFNLRPEMSINGGAAMPTNLPLLKNYRAIAADNCSQPSQMLLTHISGLNVGYATGNVRWVDRSQLPATWLAIPLTAAWGNGYDAAGTDLWNAVDALR